MGYRREIINAVFRGKQNIWTDVVVSGSNAPAIATTAVVGTFALCGTGAASARVVWLKVYSGSTGITASATGIASANGTWVRLNFGTDQS